MALIIDLKVVVQSGKHELVVDKSGSLKCFVKAEPQDGKANKEVIEILAQLVGVPKKSVEIVQGLTNRKKRIAIETSINFESFMMLVTGGVQKKIF